MITEGGSTGDGRATDVGAGTWDAGPWPLRWQEKDTPGHFDAVDVATITDLWRDGPNVVRMNGYMHDDSTDPATLRAVARASELVESGGIGVSIGVDSVVAEMRIRKDVYDKWQSEMAAMMEGGPLTPEAPELAGDRVVLDRFAHDDVLEAWTSYRFREATIVGTGAFADARLEMGENPTEGTIAIAAALSFKVPAATASAFVNPRFDEHDSDPRLVWQEPQGASEPGHWAAPLHINEDGSFYGHATSKARCHGSFAACLPPPDHGGDLSRWLVGDATGTGIPTGPIVLNTTHGVDNASGEVLADGRWLADTGTAVADATAGWDSMGMWVAGRVRPGITDRELAALRGSALSGEWHPIGNKLRLVGVLAVNQPGYLVQRVVKDSRGIAAAFYTMGPTCCVDNPPVSLEDEVATLKRAVASLMRE